MIKALHDDECHREAKDCLLFLYFLTLLNGQLMVLPSVMHS